MEMPLVSIIAVSYNHSNYVNETLNSIFAQTYPNIELIIIDDFSKDNTQDIISSWIIEKGIHCHYIRHSKNKGVCKTLNEALSYCSGKYIQIISCDDILLPNKIENQVLVFEKLDNTYGFIFSDAFIIENEISSSSPCFITRIGMKDHYPSGDIYAKLLLGNFIPAMSTLIRKDVIQMVGGFDENLPYEDYDLWLRITKIFKAFFSDFAGVKYRIHNHNFHLQLSRVQFLDYWILVKHIEKREAKYRINKILVSLIYNNAINSMSRKAIEDIRKKHISVVDSLVLRVMLRFYLPLSLYRFYFRVRI